MKEQTWATIDERKYISRLGGVALEKYLLCAELRQDWSSMDKDEILDFARKRLELIHRAEGRLAA